MSASALRPLSIGEILDGAFSVFRRHFPVLVGTTLVGLSPTLVVQLLIRIDSLFAFLYFAVSVLSLTFVTLAATQQVSEALLGRAPTIGDGMRVALRRFFAGLVAFVARSVLLVVGFMLCIVPGAYLALRTFAVFPVVALEPGQSWWKRSSSLFQGEWVKILVVSVVSWFIVLAPGLALGVATGAFSLDRATREAAQGSTIAIVLGQLIQALTLPFTTAVTVLLYYDLRVRKEGLDVRLASEALGGEVTAGPTT